MSKKGSFEEIQSVFNAPDLWAGFAPGRDPGWKRSGQRLRNCSLTVCSTSSAVEHARHIREITFASSKLIPARARATRGIAAGVMLKSVAPRPISTTAYAGVEA